MLKSELESKTPFDVLVIGGGFAGASAAIYTSRSGIRTGIVAERFGGQTLDSMIFENFVGITHTKSAMHDASLEAYVKEYDIEVINLQLAMRLEKKELIEIELENGIILKSKTVIISTGARWRNVDVPGEIQYKNRGVTYWPHCDGSLFRGKHVAVIGGGNSGVEAAIALAGIVKYVTVIEFMPELSAEAGLQNRFYSLPNVSVKKNVQIKRIMGTDNVNGIVYVERDTGEAQHIGLQGVFVQIGLEPNTDWLGGKVECTESGEIIVDKRGTTNIPGVFAAGDCINSPYKHSIISMGSGVNAALGALNYLIRNQW